MIGSVSFKSVEGTVKTITMFFIATVGLLGLTSPVNAEQVRVIARETTIRLRPDPNSDVIEMVTSGTVLEAVAKAKDWLAVFLPTKEGQVPRFGFVRVAAVERFETPEGQFRLNPANARSSVGQPRLPDSQQPGGDWFGNPSGPKEGRILGIQMPYVELGVRGAAGVTSRADPFPLPASLRSGYGIGVTFGRRSVRNSVAISFSQSRHAVAAPASTTTGTTSSQRILSTEAYYNRLNIDGGRYWLPQKRVQPFLAVGGGLVWLKVREATTIDGQPTDSIVLGIGGELGGGVAFYLHPRVAVQSALIYRLDYYAGVHEGAQGWRATNGHLHDRGLQGRSGLTFTF
jgi:hypothetical protein